MGCQCCIAAVGYGALVFALIKALTAIYNIVFPYLLAGKSDLKKKSGGANWAVVTGATDGIGKAYAFELAHRGFDVLIISRTQSKLDETKKEILAKYSGVKVDTLAFDFSNGNTSAYQPLYDAFDKIEVGILVNNVGMSYEYPETIHAVEGGLERLANITTINTLPPTLLSAAVIPQMLKRKGGVVINVASSASYDQMPLWAVYSATKKYVTWLTAIIQKEYAGKGITFQSICPMLVATKMSKVRKTSLFAPNAEQFVKSALNTVGVVEETTGYLTHQLQAEIVFSLPQFLRDLIITKMSYATRAAALRKKAKAN